MNTNRVLSEARVWVYRVGIVGLTAFSVASFSACKSKEGVSEVHSAQVPESFCEMYGSSLTGQEADRCCVSGKPRVPRPDGCPQPIGAAPTETTIVGYDGAVRTARASIQYAETLTGDSTIARNNRSAAVASTAGPDGTDAATLDPNANVIGDKLREMMKEGAGQDDSSGGGSASAGGFSGGGSGFGGLNGDIRTAPASGAEASTAAASKEAGEGRNLGVSQASGRGRSGSGSGDDVGDTISGVNSAILDIGRDPAGEVNPMGSVEPENYFSLLKPGESIFKVVEKRYGAKARQWALRDAAEVASGVQRRVEK